MLRCNNIHLNGKLLEISLAVSPGEVLGVVGSRGSVKTTLLNVLARLILPDRGAVSIEGEDGRRVDELLTRLELTASAATRTAKLTPGEAARLRLARALLHDPQVLPLDEPCGDITHPFSLRSEQFA